MSQQKMTGPQVSSYASSIGIGLKEDSINFSDLTDNTEIENPLDDKEDQKSPPQEFHNKDPTIQESPSKRKATETSGKEQPKLKHQKVAEKKEKQEDKASAVKKIESPQKKEEPNVEIENKEEDEVEVAKDEEDEVEDAKDEEDDNEEDQKVNTKDSDAQPSAPNKPLNKKGKKEEKKDKEDIFCYLQKPLITKSKVPLLSWKKVLFVPVNWVLSKPRNSLIKEELNMPLEDLEECSWDEINKFLDANESTIKLSLQSQRFCFLQYFNCS